MTESILFRLVVIAAMTAALAAAGPAWGDSQGSNRTSATVSFGAGLNTAQPGNAANHHVLPNTIEIKAGGVVNFVVAGFHQIVVYRPGVDAEDIVLPPFPPNLFINQLANAFYVGINPDNANLALPPAPAGIFNGLNRVEPVSFPEPGTYLVICNVTPHLRDGMFAYVKVSR